ncbi:hypothetical protein PQR14_29340 [Paraburkholderia bryophila]|uniref:hypothetical protein n=1 Tax=Paraburkholderia bryophila TaxID=420952 RepID=UPI0038BB1220
MNRLHTGKGAQTGQAMVEFLISMTMVMSVLLFAIVMLGKFNDVRNRTLMGSRYVAWERTVWTDSDRGKNLPGNPATTEGWSSTYGAAALVVGKTDAELKGEVMQRILAGDDLPVSSADREQTRLAATQPAMWRDYGGNALLASAADVAAGTSAAANPASSQAGSALAQWSAGSQFTAHLNLPTQTLQTGVVSIAIAKNSDTLKRLWPQNNALPAFSGLTFSDTNVLVTNTWVPDGSSSNKALFSQAVAAANVVLIPPAGYMSLQKYAPEIASLQFGRVQQDVVPAGRLKQ